MITKTVRVDPRLVRSAVQVFGVAERLYAIDAASRGIRHNPRRTTERYAVETMISNQIFHMKGLNDPHAIDRPKDPRLAALYDEAVDLHGKASTAFDHDREAENEVPP